MVLLAMASRGKQKVVWILIFVLTTGAICCGDQFDHLTPRFPDTIQNLHSISYGNGAYVAVGSGGTIISSEDTLTWSSLPSGTSNDLSGVVFGNGMFVTVGKSGSSTGATILTSVDGRSWTPRSSGGVNDLNSIGYGN